MQKPRLPGASDRIAVIGATGSGKTVAALWHLSRRDLKARPWIVFDFKDDENISLIENAEHVGLDFRPNEKSRGLYIVHPMRTDDEAVNALMLDLLARGNVGVYVDEPDMNRATGFEDVLRKGRSHRVPVISLTQRPVDCNRYMLSEANFYQVFDLADRRDWITVGQFIPPISDALPRLPSLAKHHSIYYDRGTKTLTPFKPVPKVEEIIFRIDEQLSEKRERVLV